MPNNHAYFVPIRFRGADKSYNFSTEFSDLKLGDLVVVDSISGYTMGFVSGPAKPLTDYHSELELKPILRKPTKSDMLNHNFNLKEEKRALEIVEEEIKNLGLPMDLVDAVYTLDGGHITITYTTPEKRVDFRELLRVLNPLLNCRIELRQIAPRDRAKMTGGIGICGLPLCCSTFLTSFESISINKAKNQMLTLNIPKLSGHCGKLICCLDFEDEAYTEAKKAFPHIGSLIHTPDGDYFVDSFNIISKSVRLANQARDDFKMYELEDIIAMQNGTYKERIVIKKNKEDELPSFGIQTERPAPVEESRNERQGQQNNNRHHGNNRGNNRPGQNGQQQNQGQGKKKNHGQNSQKPNQNQSESNPQQNGQQNNPNQRRPHYHNNRQRHHGNNRGNNGGSQQS